MHRVLLLISLLSLAVPASAQTSTVSGTVVDESGGALPGASVMLAGTAGRFATTTDTGGKFAFANVPPGSYRLTVSLPAFATSTSEDLVVSGATVSLPATVLKVASLAETVVVTAAKRATQLVDAPATTSVLTADVIAAAPSQSYAELLRAVPGLNVIQTSARDISLTARQATTVISNTQLALLDGRTLYLDFFGIVLWDFVPANTSDIKQIEVVRGPASAVWGANALTGVVNIITKSPREAEGGELVLTGGGFSRGAGSTEGRGLGGTFSGTASYNRVVNDNWAYRVSGGYLQSSSYPRPVGQIPVIVDPRDPSSTVGGAFYPTDGPGAFGTAFENRGSQQPKFDVRVDQEIAGGRVTYAGGLAATDGIIHTGIGPFDIQPGTYLGYGRVTYQRGAFALTTFVNLLDGEAPNLLVPDPSTGAPLQLGFESQTYDVDLSHATAIGTRHALSYGGNVRRNDFDITVTPGAPARTEVGGFLQDEIFLGRWRLSLGGRLDKFGNIDHAVFSPRLALAFKPSPLHAVRGSFNKAFRAPSALNNYFDVSLVTPVDLSGLAPQLPPPLRPAVAPPFPLVVRAVGSEIDIAGAPQPPLTEESLTAYELSYTGTFGRTSVGAAVYMNDLDDVIEFVQLPGSVDPYTATNPPPGWPLPPEVLTLMAAQGIYLPHTAFTFSNLGPLRNKGIELSLNHRVSTTLDVLANYSWQSKPTVLDDPDPFPARELAYPAAHRLNLGFTWQDRRYVSSASLHHSTRAFWSDVLTAPYHGYTDGYTLLNGSFGLKWSGGRIVTSIKATNLLNQDVQQHIFGDILKTGIATELRVAF